LITKKQKLSVFIQYLLFVIAYLMDNYTEGFRVSENFRWIYSYGQPLAIGINLIGILFSILNSVLILMKSNINFFDKLIWLLISSIPFTYFIYMLFFATIISIDS